MSSEERQSLLESSSSTSLSSHHQQTPMASPVPCMTIVMHQFNEPEYFAHELLNDPKLLSPPLAALQEQALTVDEDVNNCYSLNQYEQMEEASLNQQSKSTKSGIDWNRVQYYLFSSFLVLLPIVCLIYCIVFNLGFYIIFAMTASFFGYAPLFSQYITNKSLFASDDAISEDDYGNGENGRYSKEGYYFGTPTYSHIVPNPVPLFVYTVPVDEQTVEESLRMHRYQD